MIRSYSRLVVRIKEASRRNEYEFYELGHVGPRKQYEFIRVVINPKDYIKTVVIVSGVHGDEPAPVEAVTQFIEEKHPENNVRLLIYPVLNPWGYVHNQRKSGSNKDLNRTKSLILEPEQSLFFMSLISERVDFLLSCHEDYWSRKLYAYVFGNEYSDLYKAVLQSTSVHMQINMNSSINGYSAREGLILDHRDRSLEDIVSRTGIPSMCLETGMRAGLDNRIMANLAVIETIFS